MKTTREVLQEARTLLTPEAAWTQEVFARTSEGASCKPDSLKATCWCLSGALRRVSDGTVLGLAGETADRLAAAVGTSQYNLFEWNDAPDRTHAEVLALLDKAAKA